MRRTLDRAALGLALSLLILACFGSVLLRDEQFIHRDAGNYYYPLHARTAAQWGQGRVPLWDPDENGGLPLMGNPTAAVLYPGKLIFAAMPYPWAARMYLIAHVGLAVATMTACLRGLGISRSGAAIGGLSYGFGGPVLMQYSNAIYLVGAAWLPLGVLQIDSYLRRRRPRALAGLAFVLAMEVLGGDVQVAYMMGLFGAAYAAWLSRQERARGPSGWGIAAAVGAWIAAVPFLAAWLPTLREWEVPTSVAWGMGHALRLGVIVAVLAWLLRETRGRRAGLAGSWGGLLVAACVGAAVAGAQLGPVWELSSLSFRMSDDIHMDPYGYSLEPYRALEAVWPGGFGIESPENRLWLLAVPPVGMHALWASTLYVGALPVLLALASIRGRGGPAWRAPMAALVAVGLLLSFGRFGSPLWWARLLPGAAPYLGAHGVNGSSLFRAEDGLVRDAFGSPYWFLATVAPGFGSFRFPSKQLVFVALGMSALAGLGWDRLRSGACRPGLGAAMIVLGATAVAGLASIAFRGPILDWLARSARVPSLNGPIDPPGALWEMRRSMLHAGLAFAASAGLIRAAARGRGWSAALAVGLLAADLAVANARFIVTIPQAVLDGSSRVADLISEHERENPSPGPYRIQRLPEWHPLRWVRTRSPDRPSELTGWQIDTVQSGYGMLHGIVYTLTPGVLEPERFLDMFDPTTIALDASAASLLGIEAGHPIRYYPRRAFDLWGARYFVLPRSPYNWLDPNRAIASFLPQAEVLYPRPEQLRDPAFLNDWDENRDWQLLRNERAFPRAWIVHDVKARPGPFALESREAQAVKRSLLYQDDPFWTIPGREVDDPRVTAWVEAEPGSLGVRLDGAPPSPGEAVVVTPEGPARVVVDATLERDGFVVLAEQFYPGWTLAIDGSPATILRTNLAMRGAAVPAGRHRLVFTYEPGTFRFGLIASGLGVLALLALAIAPRRTPPETGPWAA